MLFKLPFKDSEMSWSQRCGLRLRSSYKSAVLPNASAASAAATCWTCWVCWIGMYSEAHGALFQRSWDKLRPGGPIKQGIQTYSFCVWLGMSDAFSWGPFGPDQSEEAGAYTPGRVSRSLSWRRVEHCYCYWLHSFGKKHIDTKLHSRILHSVVPVQEMAQGFSLGLVSSLGFSRRRVGMDESCYSCGGSFVVLDHCTLIHIDSSLYILLLSWSRSSPSSKPWFLGFHADTKRQHADYISLETVNTSWDTSNGRQEMHWRNTKTT